MEKKHTPKRPEIPGWELIKNEKGVEMAVINAQLLRDTLKYAERIESTNLQLLEALKEVVRISDRKHDAWDKAKELIKKCEG